MQITLNLDDALIQDAMRLNPDLPLEKAIESALALYVRQQQRSKTMELFGAIDYDPDYDYKNQRTRA
ncbi:type II toxin-antitoxin system VapB family antitoxin [Anthocerotibacter panamensis]|uniref:type II toxin-antitoxin system VapB family antitoxin n=1 Tax=Anthocerotibacter panamensis TaxID=2857077 RepID=UPI001C405FEF|nr:type II toxin-antitoxin system VapB family antitoxin [Anthocerotibacter panamensis]